MIGLASVPLLAAAGPSLTETTRLSFLSAPPVWVLVLVVLPAVIAFAVWSYARRDKGRGLRSAAVLRALVLGLLIVFLMQPVRLTQKMIVERPVAAVLLDDSASLRERDLPELARSAGLPAEATRSEVVSALLAPELTRLSERYEVQLFAFGEGLRALGGLSDLAAADGSTALGDALASLAAETRGRQLAQVLVVTDGRSNAGREPAAAVTALSARRVPLHFVGVGDPDVPPDVRVASVNAPEIALAGDTVSFEVSVAARGFPGAPATLVITDSSNGAELAREDFRLADTAGASEQVVRVGFVPAVEGDLDLVLRVLPQPAERDTANNSQRRLLRVEPGRIRVLYVDGYPRYEYRFLKDSLLRLSNVEVQVLLLDASPEFLQESSPGLPALLRFPPTLTDLLQYHVIIFGDVHPQDLGPDHERHLSDIKSFVEAGGGFLLQAGKRDAPREYANTPIAEILPVILGDSLTEWGHVHDPGAPFRPRLSRARDPHEIVTLMSDVERNRELWETGSGLAPLTWYWPVARARASAEVLLSHPDSSNSDGPHVLLATMFWPQGRTAWLGTDETWRWRFRFLETYREPFWKNLVRYLALNRLRRSDYRFELSTDVSEADVGARVTVTARVRDAEFEPLGTEVFPVEVQRPDGRRESLSAERQQPGIFVTTLAASELGPWRLWLEDPLDSAAGPRSPRVLNVRLPSAENDDPLLDEQLLRQLAAAGGGRYLRLSEAPRFVAGWRDPPRERAVDEPEREELWSGYPQLLLLLGLLSAEWILRKRNNLV